MTALILQAIFSGILAGGAYALIALGLALTFGTMKIINLAHGELVLLAAYIAFTLESALGVNPLWTIPAAVMVVGAVGAAVNQLVTAIKLDRELNSLILTYGIGILLTNAVLLIWKAHIRTTATPWFQEAVVIGPLYAARSEVFFFGLSLILLFSVWWWLAKSWYGRAVRAVSSDPEAAKLMGINPRKTELVSFVLAGGLAAVAGVAIYTYGIIQPSLGHALTVKAFIITVLAGMGSIPGILVGSMLLGITETLTTTFYSSALQELTGMVLFLLVLYFLPNGLFGRARRQG